MARRLAIDGGPCGGKTTIMSRLEDEFKRRDFGVEIVPEAATYLMEEEQIYPWDDPFLFQCRVLEKHLVDLRVAEELLEQYGKRGVILCDRGGPSGEAYVSADVWSEVLRHMGLTRAKLFHEYSGAIHLVTAADGAREFYTRLNNKTRIETPEQAIERDLATRRVWLDFPYHYIVYNPPYGGFERKIENTLEWVQRRFGLETDPIESEHKWLVLDQPQYVRQMIASMGSTGVFRMRQNYLRPPQGENVVRRVRMITYSDDSIEYVYEEKRPTDQVHVRFETPEQYINEEEYKRLLHEELFPDSHTIEKVRTRIPWQGHTLEIDELEEPEKLIFIEIETPHPDTMVAPPGSFNLRNVTGVERYTMFGIARGLGLS